MKRKMSLGYGNMNQLVEKIYLRTHNGYISFEKPIQKRFLCTFCEDLLKDPIQTERGGIACENCYQEKRKDIGDLCPLDGEKIENIKTFIRPDKYVAREITKIKVKCFYEKCKWVGALDDINHHESTDCEFATTECGGCNEEVIRKHFKQHELDECRNVEMVTSGQQDTQNMKNQQCPYGCGTMIDYEIDFKEHIHNCKMVEEATDCPYKSLGCDTKDSNETVRYHIEKQHNDPFSMAAILKLCKDNERLKSELKDHKKLIHNQSSEVGSLRNELKDTKNQLQRMNENIDAKRKEVYDLTKQMDQITTQFKEMNNTEFYEKKLKQLNEMHDQFKSTSSPFQNIQDLEKLSKNTESVRFLEKEQAMLNANLADAELKMQLLENLSTNGHQIWRIDNFRYRVEQAMKGKIVALHSAPCYTSLNGYKFCIRVYPNGDGMGRNTHLSIYFVLMKNHYDNLLEWPFQRKVTFKVLNFRDISRSKKETFITDRNSTSFQKPKKEMNIAAGCPKFLSKELLENDGFLNDDSIFVETIVEDIDNSKSAFGDKH